MKVSESWRVMMWILGVAVNVLIVFEANWGYLANRHITGFLRPTHSVTGVRFVYVHLLQSQQFGISV